MIIEFYTNTIERSAVYCDDYKIKEKAECILLYRKVENRWKVGYIFYKLYELVRLIDNDGKVSIIYKKEKK